MNHRVILAIFLFAWASQLPAQQGTGARRLSPSSMGNRVALVIGNKAYPWKPLVNPENDARAVAAALKDAGFTGRDIHLVIDARQIDLRREVRQFVESVKPGDLAFIYYSGHGVEVKGNNYLLPVDLPRDATEGYVQDEAVSAQRLLRDLNDQGAAVRVLVLDACRDNPLRATKSLAGGLAPMESSGSLVVFSTEAGRTADDNPGGTNGLFTQYLLEGLRERGVSLDEAMKHVSRKVARATGQRQIPALYGLLMEDLILIPGNPQNNSQQTADNGPRYRLQTDLSSGLGVFRFGMSPSQINSLLPQRFGNTTWQSLPVAGEFSPDQVRYYWERLAPFARSQFGLDHLEAFSPCWGKSQSYVTFLFSDEKLCRISIRLLPDCGQRVQLLHQVAQSMGAAGFDGERELAFQMVLAGTTVEGHVVSDAATLEVFQTGSPHPHR